MNTLFNQKTTLLPVVNVIGCGKLGKTIAKLLVKNKLIEINQIYNRTTETNMDAIQFVGEGQPCTNLSNLGDADIYFICVSDDKIKDVCDTIAQNLKAKKAIGKIIFVHFSGLLTSEALSAVSLLGHEVCSLHPLKSFARPAESTKNFAGTFCTFEGSQIAYAVLSPLFQKIGGKLFSIEKEKKAAYHAACVFASNYTTTLAYLARECFRYSGMDDSVIKEIVLSLMQGSLDNMKAIEKIEHALTGPFQRGDISIISNHLESLNGAPELKEVYKILGKNAVKLTSHPEETKLKILNTLYKE